MFINVKNVGVSVLPNTADISGDAIAYKSNQIRSGRRDNESGQIESDLARANNSHNRPISQRDVSEPEVGKRFSG